jgi:hypothetical protein
MMQSETQFMWHFSLTNTSTSVILQSSDIRRFTHVNAQSADFCNYFWGSTLNGAGTFKDM